MDELEPIRELLQAAYDLPDGPERVERMQDIVRIADRSNQIAAQMLARQYLIDSAEGAEMVDLCLAVFAWCLAKVDQHPELKANWVLSEYLGLSVRIVDTPQIPLDRIVEVHDDLAERFKRRQSGSRVVAHSRWRAWMRMGKFDEAFELREAWMRLPKDSLTYDRASELDSEVELYCRSGRNREALLIAEPILSGRLASPPVIPRVTYNSTLLAAMRLDEEAEARSTAESIFEKISAYGANSEGLFDASHLTLYFGFAKRPRDLKRMLQDGLQRLSESRNTDNHFYFCATLAAALKALRGTEAFAVDDAIQVPNSLQSDLGATLAAEDDVERLQQWAGERADSLAAQFDARNGNESYRDLLRDFERIAAR